MTRKLLIASATMVALIFGLLSLTAQAQSCTYNGAVVDCATTTTSSGNVAGAFTTANPQPSAAAATATDTAAASNDSATIAFTGVESSVLGYVGAGLIGFGAVALGVRRKL